MRFTGIISTYFHGRAFGFIRSDKDGVERFFHKSSHSGGEPQVGIEVGFEIGPPNRLGKPDQCMNVRPLNVPSAVRVVDDPVAQVAQKFAQEGGEAGAQ